MGAAVGYGYYDIGIILTVANLAVLMLSFEKCVVSAALLNMSRRAPRHDPGLVGGI
jgi:hypothetical protein